MRGSHVKIIGVFGFPRVYFKSVTSDVWILIRSIKHRTMTKQRPCLVRRARILARLF